MAGREGDKYPFFSVFCKRPIFAPKPPDF